METNETIDKEKRVKFMDKKIGELNGVWAMMLKLSLVLLPFWVGWSVWVTKTVFSHETSFKTERIETNERIEIKTDLIRADIQKVYDKLNKLELDFAKHKP